MIDSKVDEIILRLQNYIELEYVSKKELEKILGVSYESVRAFIKNGDITIHHKNGAKSMIQVSNVCDFVGKIKERVTQKEKRNRLKLQEKRECEYQRFTKILEKIELRFCVIGMFECYGIPVEHRCLHEEELGKILLLPEEQRRKAVEDLARSIKGSLKCNLTMR